MKTPYTPVGVIKKITYPKKGIQTVTWYDAATAQPLLKESKEDQREREAEEDEELRTILNVDWDGRIRE